mmetsp:Transcript_34198/g.72804  ORF Transcript_34198/g.72804 Transcript_34198/m.72804 type:complete len:218 (-) Transcript_34198:1278-1931(-)
MHGVCGEERRPQRVVDDMCIHLRREQCTVGHAVLSREQDLHAAVGCGLCAIIAREAIDVVLSVLHEVGHCDVDSTSIQGLRLEVGSNHLIKCGRRHVVKNCSAPRSASLVEAHCQGQGVLCSGNGIVERQHRRCEVQRVPSMRLDEHGRVLIVGAVGVICDIPLRTTVHELVVIRNTVYEVEHLPLEPAHSDLEVPVGSSGIYAEGAVRGKLEHEGT